VYFELKKITRSEVFLFSKSIINKITVQCKSILNQRGKFLESVRLSIFI
jgi:hypothetical protein